MLKTMFKQTTKVLKEKFNKTRITEKITKHPNCLEKAKEILTKMDDNLKISNTVGNKLIPKVNEFEKALIAKFPELTKDDVTEIKQSIIEDFDAAKDAALKELQDFNTKLQEENEKLKNQLSKFSSVDNEKTIITPDEITESSVITPIESSIATVIDEKQENTQE